MLSNRRTASLACDACVDSYYRYGVICTQGDCMPKLATIENDNTLITVYGEGDKRIMAFRGTDDPVDWRENFWVMPQKTRETPSYERMRPFVPSVSPKIHGGFYGAYRRVSESIRDAFDEFSVEGGRWLLTGHSLGGALASITTTLIRFEHSPDLVTFGCPKWGNRHATWLCSQKARMILRFTNGNDVVPHLPAPVGPWNHAAPSIHLHGEDAINPIAAHSIFDYRVGLNRYNG